MKVMNQPSNLKYNCLFLPGLPGRVKHFECFDDIINTGGRINWLQYSGTYESQNGTDFTIESSVQDIHTAIRELSEEGMPILIVAYSYSTMLMNEVDFTQYPLIAGMALFSPIKGIDRESISEDFNDTISALHAQGDITTDEAQWRDVIARKDTASYDTFLEKFSGYSFPVMIAYARGDTVIKADIFSEHIAAFGNQNVYNKLLIFEQKIGYHKLDSYYDAKIGNFFRLIEPQLDNMNIHSASAGK
jgi:hypothetical protein